MTYVYSWNPATIVLLVTLLCARRVSAQETVDRRPDYLRHALEHDGDAAAGKLLFRNHAKLLCTDCHDIAGKEKSGPDLDGIADKYDREQLIREILYPSQSIKPGFEQVTLLTDDGLVYTGRIERANKNVHRLIDAKGKQTDIPTETIDEKQVSSISLMPDNVATVLSVDEFTDLIAYLRTLTFGVHSGQVAGGAEIEIPRLETPVTFRPIHSPEEPFVNPVWCGALPGTDSDLLVIEHQTARVWRLIRDGDDLRRELFLDLSGETYFSNNQGLMCLAFHPEFTTNRRYFIEHEVNEDGVVKTGVFERKASADGLKDSGQPSRRLLDVVQPAFNHNGGCLIFGPDGMLYIAFGDGGPQRDPPGYSQSLNIFLGAMLRIDVDRTEGDLPYGIPPDNPFVDAHKKDPSIRPEIWAYGFREPWRYSFDSATGELYVGDVGQDTYEEVSIVRRGENHGWNVREAFAPFSDEYRREGESYTDPIFAYEHGLGFSVTGGFVYHGRQNDTFDGVYIFGDYNTRRVWGLKQQDGVVERVVEIGTAPGGIASFGLDQQGEIYLVTYLGMVYHVDLSGAVFDGVTAPRRDVGTSPATGNSSTVRVAGIVLKWLRTDKEANFHRAESLIREAADGGAQIVCTTECFLDGYAIKDKSIPLDDYRALGEKIPGGEFFKRLSDLADELEITLIAGMLEANGEHRYNTAVVIGPDGELIGRYRKQELGHELVRNTPGTESPVFETQHGRLAVMICADRRYPDLVKRLCDNGVDMLLCPSGGMFGPKSNDHFLQARSQENDVPIVFVHPAEFLVTGPDGRIETSTILGDRLEIDANDAGGEADSKHVFYFDVPTSR